jgi:hypothetical protein
MKRYKVTATVYVWAEDDQAAVERTGAALDNYSLEDDTTLLHGVDAYVSVVEAK